MNSIVTDNIPENKKIYFASDFHLGTPNYEDSRERERKIVAWLNQISKDVHTLFLVGDLFDFWFEYKTVVPKGYVRFLGKLAELSDKGVQIYLFTGNHDMWMFDYLEKELNVKILREPTDFIFNNKKFHIGHGDGLGPGDETYKVLKKIFANKLCQWLFERIHPNLGIGIANAWSRKSRAGNNKKEEIFHDKEEWIYQYCLNLENNGLKYDYYIFGHRHLPIDMQVSENSRYLNLGEWINYFSYASFDGNRLSLETF